MNLFAVLLFSVVQDAVQSRQVGTNMLGLLRMFPQLSIASWPEGH